MKIVHKMDFVTDKVWPYVDNGVFLDGRRKAWSVTRVKHPNHIGTQLTDNI